MQKSVYSFVLALVPVLSMLPVEVNAYDIAKALPTLLQSSVAFKPDGLKVVGQVPLKTTLYRFYDTFIIAIGEWMIRYIIRQM